MIENQMAMSSKISSRNLRLYMTRTKRRMLFQTKEVESEHSTSFEESKLISHQK